MLSEAFLYNSPFEKYNVKENILVRQPLTALPAGLERVERQITVIVACLGKEDMMGTVLKNLKGFLYAFILFILLTFLISAAVKFTPVPEGWSLYYMVGVLCITCLFLGIYIGNYTKKKGFIYGALYSIIFLLILSAFYMLAFSTGIDMGFGLIKYLVPVLFGSVGGMIGVNLRG